MKDKILLLMEETGCDQGEAELALEMCGYEVYKAVKTIARLLKNIVVLKGRFIQTEEHRFGLFLLVANIKSGALLRCRAVISYNPAVYPVSLDKEWFDFEKFLFGCRLWEGSLQGESQEIEQALYSCFGSESSIETLSNLSEEKLGEEIRKMLSQVWQDSALSLQLKKEILDMGQFKSLRSEPERALVMDHKPATAGRELLILKITLEEDSEGIPAEELRCGDIVSAHIVDSRDIAQYLAKIFGALSDEACLPVAAPIEAVEKVGEEVLARTRFSLGVCGDTVLTMNKKIKVIRRASLEYGPRTWWRRFF